MPELPEVETIKNDLDRYIRGKMIKSVEVRKAKMVSPAASQFKRQLTGKTIKSVRRRAKMLVFELSDGKFLLVHLKMTGQFIFDDGVKVVAKGGHLIPGGDQNLPNKYTHVIFKFDDDSHLYYNDLRQFGWLRFVGQSGVDKEESKYGPEPLSAEFSQSVFDELLDQNERSKIKQLLMNQSKIAGIGNIYADEICFYSGVRPMRVIKTLTRAERQKLYRGIKSILNKAIAKRGTSVDNYRDARGKKGGFASFLKVYGRKGQPCKKCGTSITKIKFIQRGTHYCPQCQK